MTYADKVRRHRAIDLEIAKFNVGYGWHELVTELYNYFYRLYDEYGVFVGVEEIKEKFGVLRLYYIIDGDNMQRYYDLDLVDQTVLSYEARSSTICEDCGLPGNIRKVYGWCKTLCAKCYQETMMG